MTFLEFPFDDVPVGKSDIRKAQERLNRA